MKNDEHGAEVLLRQMGRLVVPLVTPELEASRHDRMASSVNRLLQRLRAEPPPRRLPVRALGAFAAVAASLGLLFGARRLLRPPQVPPIGEVAQVISVSGESTLLRVGSSPSAVFAKQRVDAMDELRSTSGARAELALTGAGKARVDISEDTRVRLNQRLAGPDAASEDWLELTQGLVTLQVAKLPPGLGLSVQTPDARVTVHGTRFSVRVSSRTPSGTVTFVAVTEGRVEVDSRGQVVFLGPGDHWSSQISAPESEAAPSSLLDPHANAPEGAARPVTTSLARPPTSARAARVSESTLAEENRLYAQALTHAGAGELSLALADLATLIERYPGSPLAQNARVDRFRLLQQSGKGSAAAQEARRYLSEYPNGFARSEARRLALLGLETPE
jgi:ferric-dicitrate binding protein FerR (iron transport regulator)